MRARFYLAHLFVALSLAPFVSATYGQAAPPNHAKLELIADQSAFDSARPLWVGVLFHLDPGWHVYWQNPGDSGTPPRIEWMVPQGFHAGAIRWPIPHRLGSGSVIDYGYENQVLLMAPVKAPVESAGPATIGAQVKYVVCREICIPGKAQLSISVPPSKDHVEHPSGSRDVFEKAQEQFPKPAPPAWRFSAKQNRDEFQLIVHGAPIKRAVSFFPLDSGVIDNPAPQKISAVDGSFSLSLKKSELLTKPVLMLKGLLDVPGSGTYEIAVPVASDSRSR